EFPQQERAKKLLADISGSMNSSVIREHYTNALDSIKKGDYEKAVRALKAILQLDPMHPQAKRMIVNARRLKLKSTYEMADKFLIEGQYLKARQAYEKALKNNPSDSATATTLVRLEEITRLADSLDGEGREARLMRTSLYNYASAEGNIKVSVAAAWYANQLAPENPMTQTIRNFIEEKNHQVLRLLDPPSGEMDVVEQKLFAALNHIYEGRYDLAVEESGLVLELSPGNTMALKRMGSAYYLMGENDRAGEVWRRALKLTPNDDELKGFLDILK
ncbi:MAG TPA: hypothetical protein ENI12_05845, partial [Nitrospirae bacterium]|nr:hypothetical protein [Nitrospirota bacterium]